MFYRWHGENAVLPHTRISYNPTLKPFEVEVGIVGPSSNSLRIAGARTFLVEWHKRCYWLPNRWLRFFLKPGLDSLLGVS